MLPSTPGPRAGQDASALAQVALALWGKDHETPGFVMTCRQSPPALEFRESPRVAVLAGARASRAAPGGLRLLTATEPVHSSGSKILAGQPAAVVGRQHRPSLASTRRRYSQALPATSIRSVRRLKLTRDQGHRTGKQI